MTTVNPYGSSPYQQYPTQAYAPQQAYAPTTQGYSPDGYQQSPYTTGYMSGANAVAGPAMGIGGMAGGISSLTSTVGGIFGAILDIVAGILNTIVNIVVSLVEGVLGLFGIGKKDKNQDMPGGMPMAGDMSSMPLPNNQGMGVSTPAGTPVPPPPPGTDIQAAYNIVQGDVQNIRDPNQGIQLIDIHAMKARDYRDKAEQFAKEAEKESREAAYIAEDIQKRGADPTKLAKLQQHKSKAVELLKTAQEYTKAVYDEALYAQAANDILNAKFQGGLGNNGNQKVTEAWKNWIGGSVEKKYLIFTNNVKAAPEVFMQAMNAVNANIGRATQVLNALAGVR